MNAFLVALGLPLLTSYELPRLPHFEQPVFGVDVAETLAPPAGIPGTLVASQGRIEQYATSTHKCWSSPDSKRGEMDVQPCMIRRVRSREYIITRTDSRTKPIWTVVLDDDQYGQLTFFNSDRGRNHSLPIQWQHSPDKDTVFLFWPKQKYSFFAIEKADELTADLGLRRGTTTYASSGGRGAGLSDTPFRF